MRVTWIGAACILAIAVAALNMQAGDRWARLLSPPSGSMAALEGWVLADGAGTRVRNDERNRR